MFTRRSLQRRPPITLTVRRVDKALWPLFAPHHYLSATLSKSAHPFAAFIDDQPVAFTAVNHFCHPTYSGWKEHRTVCLPDFQGVGIGNALSEFIASCYAAKGVPYRSTTSHPAMILHRAKSPLWHMTRKPGRQARHTDPRFAAVGSSDRLTASFEYVGPANREAAVGFGIVERGA